MSDISYFDDDDLEPPPTSEEEEINRRRLISLAELVEWYVARNLPLHAELEIWVFNGDNR
jgi:hypothetical protein